VTITRGSQTDATTVIATPSELQKNGAHSPPKNRGISAVGYLPGLDGMRAIAVIAVMIYHANADWLPGGYLGVEVFFVISGYLITLLLISERERTGKVALGQFWLRRARRLLPALGAMLALVMAYTAAFQADSLGQLRGDVVAGLTYVTNWYQIWVGQGYTAAGDFAPLRHLWSLAVEEQFYLIWPLVMMAILARGSRNLLRAAQWLVVLAVAVTVVSVVAFTPGRIAECDVTPEQYWMIGDRCISKLDTLYLSSLTRSSGLLLGAAFAMMWRPAAIMRGPLRTKGLALDVVGIVGILGLFVMFSMVYLVGPDGGGAVLFRGGLLLCAVLTLMVTAAVTHSRALTGRLLGNPVLLWVGTRSYGLYLYHWPIYQAIRKVAGNPLTVIEFVLAMIATGVITEISYRVIETPIRRGTVGAWWKRLREPVNAAPRRVVLASVATAIALTMFGAVSMAMAPLTQNEIAESLEEASGAVVDLGGILDLDATGPVVTDPPPVPSTTEANSVTTETTIPETTVPVTTAAPQPPIPYLAVGDSVMLGAAPQLAEMGILVDAQVSRQMRDVVPVMQLLRDQDRFGNAVVVHLGTNGAVGSETLEAFMDTLTNVPKVVVMTVRAPRNWIPGNNERIRALTDRPNVILVDWEQLAQECPGNCFYSDGIHLRPDGREYYATLLRGALGI
jgi:peptidoglycan/LPS O-acetylase OafA/YrhL